MIAAKKPWKDCAACFSILLMSDRIPANFLQDAAGHGYLQKYYTASGQWLSNKVKSVDVTIPYSWWAVLSKLLAKRFIDLIMRVTWVRLCIKKFTWFHVEMQPTVDLTLWWLSIMQLNEGSDTVETRGAYNVLPVYCSCCVGVDLACNEYAAFSDWI